MSRAVRAIACCLAWSLTMAVAEAGSALAGKATLRDLSFAELDGWAADDHAAALGAFLRSCRAILASDPALRPAQAPQPDLLPVCRAALGLGDPSPAEARAFFEAHFQPTLIVPSSGNGFLTGYYEPEFEGSRTATPSYRVPLLDRPGDLVTVPQGESLPGLEGLQAARRTATGHEPYPDRAAIEDGTLGSQAKPIVYLREPGEAFIIHVQGSARIRLDDGSVMRVAYAGRNGRPYTSIGRLLVQGGVMDLETMTLEKLMGWLRGSCPSSQTGRP